MAENKPDEKIHLAFMADPGFAARVDQVCADLEEKNGYPVSRAAVLRVLVTRGLELLEAEEVRK
jgi:hypothetical protein